MKFKSEVQLEALNNAGTDTDKFLVSKADGTVSFRTGAEVLSDIGGASSTYGIKRGIAASTVPDVYTTTINGVSSYVDGDAYLIRFTSGNTTGCTLNINNIGSRTLYRNNNGPLIGGDIQDGGEMLCVYNLALLAFQCIGTSPNDIIAYVTNNDTVTITKGQPVHASGGVGDRMTVKLAYNTTDLGSAQTVGLVLSASIAAGQKGFIMMQGLLSNLSTLSTFLDGDAVYLGTTAGSITNVKQYAPNHLVYLGFVTTASPGNAGRMYVRVQNGYELDELHNVQAQAPTNKDTLYYDDTVTPKQWKTASISTILGYTPADDADVVHNTGAETIAGVKTFTSGMNAVGITSTTNANLAVPIKGIASWSGIGQNNNIGVFGEANNIGGGIGVKGVSLGGNGIVGQSSEGSGVYGYTTIGAGVEGYSTSNIGLVGNGPTGIQANSDALGISIPLQTNTTGLAIIGLTSVNINALPIYVGIDDTEVMSVNRQGHINANSFKKIGGSPTQYLMADGSTTTNGWVDYSLTSSITGWNTAAYTQRTIRYSISGKTLTVQYHISGTSNSTSTSFTIPVNTVTVTGMTQSNNCVTINNGVNGMGFGAINSNSNLVSFSYFSTGTALNSTWTASGVKTVRGVIILEIA